MLRRIDDRERVDVDKHASSVRTLSAIPPPPSDGDRLHQLLDSLIALRLEFANETDGERALVATSDRTTLVKVRKILDTAIENTKIVIETASPPEPPKLAQCALFEPRATGKLLD